MWELAGPMRGWVDPGSYNPCKEGTAERPDLPAQETGPAIFLRKVGPSQVLPGSTELRERRIGRKRV